MRLDLMLFIHSRNVGLKESKSKAKKFYCTQVEWDKKKEATNWMIYFKEL